MPSLQEVYLRAQQCLLGDSVLVPSVDSTATTAYGVGDHATRGGGTFGRGRGRDSGRGGVGRDLPVGRGGRPRSYCSHCRCDGHYLEMCNALHPELCLSSEPRFGRSTHLSTPDTSESLASPSHSSPAPTFDGVFLSRANYDESQRLRLTSNPPSAGFVQPGSSSASLLISSSSSSWIIDSGASNHMTGSLD
ncbi:uncharacterized protein LOC143886443 [Tasmannia lanceolata]|uniref:uncharacterized protein LOC143886443 n=1 Tax=Tasmannia lanceolata TaxID=3420 RepID=UPI004063FE21